MASQIREKDGGSAAPKTLLKFQSRDLPSRRLLGKGLRGIVYETMLKDGARYARKDFVDVPKDIFQEEAAVLIGLDMHENLVKTYGVTLDDRSCSLVLEYMDDDLVSFLQKRKESKRSQAGVSRLIDSSLDKFIEERRKNPIIPDTSPPPLGLREALDVMLQIARGMEYLHEHNIAHGDLKPRNVLVSYSDEGEEISVKVADFGLVETKSKSMSFVSPGARKLDMARWKAPEYLSLVFDEKSPGSDSNGDDDTAGRLGDDDWLCRADVYSFAVTSFQILTGEVPYSNLMWRELVDEIVSHGLRPTLPAAFQSMSLNALLQSCWGNSAQRPTFSTICDRLLELIQPDTLSKPTDFSGGVKPPMISTTPPYLIPTKQQPLNEPLVPKRTWDIEHGMDTGVYHEVLVGLTEADIEKNEGIDQFDEEDDALQPYYEIKSLLWIKRNTVHTVSLDEWDRKANLLSDRVDKKEKRSGELKNRIYQLIGIFLLLQGVLFTAVAQVAQSSDQIKNCKKVWSPVVLAALVWAVTIVGVWQKLSRIQVIDDECSEEDQARREAVRRVNILRNYGRRFKFRDLKEKAKAPPPKLYYGFGSHFWIHRFGVSVLTLSVFTVIFIASHFLVLCDRGMAPIKASSLAN